MDILEVLKQIPASDCDYQEWVNVGMALKHEGYAVQDWDNWSRPDDRYKPGACQAKWNTFNGSTSPVTAATIVHMAQERGIVCSGSGDEQLDYDSAIVADGDAVGIPLPPSRYSRPVDEIIAFLRAVFDPDEYVGYVTEVYENDGRLSPTRGCYDRTAGKLITLLEKCNGQIWNVLGDSDPRAGAWVRVNPLDGKGVKDENVTDYRYVLVESDSIPIERQNALIRELELPVVALTYTGGKSVHAIVHIDAGNREEYRSRVAYLFDICAKNGLAIDKACKNPSRLSRLPGFQRGDKRQYLIDTDIGKESFAAWKDYIESLSDDLPDMDKLSDVWEDMPDLSPPLIDGVLRMGHKMLIAGPSKAGKSFALIELCVCFAEGVPWMGFQCRQGRVLYVNLELDKASCLHRFKDVYTSLCIQPDHISSIDIWNLRGRSVPMDQLAPKLIRRAAKQDYTAIIIDPIYKVITGDENSADQMAHFCNQFDKVCTELGCAVIYCHHHSKGSQGGKRSMDRAAGSGVFARDPDALLDMIELPISDQLRQGEEDKQVCRICSKWLHRFLGNHYDDHISQDDEESPVRMLEHARTSLRNNSMDRMMEEIHAAKKTVQNRTAWRIDGTLREFPKFTPINVWFDYPTHSDDQTGVLKDIDPEVTWQKNFPKRKSNKERAGDRKSSIETAFSAAKNEQGQALISDIVEYMGVSEKTVRRRLKEHGGYWVDDCIVGKK